VDAILQVIAGLEAAQAVGVLHRDVKPSNCFVDTDGTVKIGDFGLSRSTASRGESHLSISGIFLGTPTFASPEQLRGDELDQRSDIYAVGVTLFYLLTGKVPFEADNMVKLVATVLEKPAPSPAALRLDLPKGLARTVQRCLEKLPQKRFKSYSELRLALLPYSSQVAQAAPPGRRLLTGVLDFVTFLILVSIAEELLRMLSSGMGWTVPGRQPR